MANPREDPWAIDEVHFQPHGSIEQMWFRPETEDPVLLHFPTCRSAGFFGNVGLRDGTLFSHREKEKSMAPASLSFRKPLIAAVLLGSGGSLSSPAMPTMIMPGGIDPGVGLCGQIRPRFTTVPLDSPDLNLIERDWKLT
jgi:hypothetical protein